MSPFPLGILASARRAGASYFAEVMADSPIAYWRMDESSGSVLTDATGSHHGTISGAAPTYGAPSLLPSGEGTALGLPSGVRTISVPHAAALNAVSGVGITISVWVKVDNPSSDALQVIIEKNALSGSSNGQWGVWYDNRSSQGSPRRIRFQMAGSGWVDWGGSVPEAAVAAGGFLTCAVGAAAPAMVYWNGIQVTTGSTLNAWSAGNTLPINIGRASAGFPLVGALDEISLFSGALAPARVLAHAQAAGVA